MVTVPGHVPVRCPPYQFKLAVLVFNQGGSALYPVAIIAIQNAIDVAHFGVMDMSTNDPLKPPTSGFRGHGRFKVIHIGQCLFHPALEVRRQGPVRQPKTRAQMIQVAIEPQSELVQVVPQIGQPLRTLNHAIKVVTVNDPQPAAISRDVNRVLRHLNTSKLMPDETTRKFIMISWHIDHATAFARPTQQLLNHIVV